MLVVSIVVAKILYDIATIKTLGKLWYPSHSGSYDIEINVIKLILSYPVFVFVTIVMFHLDIKSILIKTSFVLLVMLYYIPMHSAFYLMNTSTSFFALFHLYVLIAFLCVIIFNQICAKNVISKKGAYVRQTGNESYTLVMWTLSLICLTFVLYKLSYNGFQFSLNLESDYVYSQRSEYLSELALDVGTVKSYVVSIITNLSVTGAPLLILLSLLRKKYAFAGIGLLCVFSHFSLIAGKSVIFSLGLVAIVYLMHKFRISKKFYIFVIYGLLVLLVMSIIIPQLYYLVIRRTMFVPAWLNSLYYSFFSKNPLLLWSQDAVPFKWFIPDVYNSTLLNLISNEFFLGSMPSPNTGLFAEAFMHFGFFGVLFYPFLISLILIWFSRVYDKFDNYVSLFVALKLSISLTNVPITRIDFVISYIIFTMIISIVRSFSQSKYFRNSSFLTRLCPIGIEDKNMS